MEFAYATLHEAIAAAHPTRDALIWRDQRLTWADITDRTRRLAAVLAAHGIGPRPEATSPQPWESAQHHVALYLHNGNAYLEGMLGAWKARAAAVNVNYRYVNDELTHVLADSGATGIVYQGCFADRLAEVLPRLTAAPLLLRVDDGSGDELLPGALDYEDALAATEPLAPLATISPDDLYVLYTGGTTGYPKGVLWRQADFLVSALGLSRRDGTDFASMAEVVARAERGDRVRSLPAPPFMHGAAHWNALSTWLSGGTVIVQDHVERFDPADVLETATAHRASTILIVGDAFARPLVDELERGHYQLPHLRHIFSSGAILSTPLKEALLRHLPGLRILDVLGSSESGRQGMQRTSADTVGRRATFERDATSVVISHDHTRVLEPGDSELGWLATIGRVPRGYLGDEAKTRRTFPVIDGVRYAVPGDRARLLPDGAIELQGRDSGTINSGGEKIFAEEVEHALKDHPDVHDALVVGRSSERWGQEVVAVVAVRPGTDPSPDDLRSVASRHIARYKLPKTVVFVPEVPRSPSGKPDYAAAAALVAAPT